MANPLRGEVELVAGGKTYILRLSINAIASAEGLLDKSVNEIIASLDRLTTLRAIFWAGLQEHQPSLSLFDAGDLIGAIGADVAGNKIGEALKLAFPDPDPNARPPMGQDGSGKPS